MAKRIKSGLKRRRQNEVRRNRNRAVRTRVRNAIKVLRAAITSGDAGQVKELLPRTVDARAISVRPALPRTATPAR
ncbi:MAG: hypothetical protein B7Z61_09040 [Acidobacteria bacterium 37-71-11]|nr:MAG: hypothetical protein B7Z61_09040 [Acidobacteria bacterium 37-71-11]